MLATKSANLTQPHEASTERPRMVCPVASCDVEGTVQGIRRHVSHAHGLDKDARDALVNSALIAAGRTADISTGNRKTAGAKLAAAVHWADTLPDTELFKAARKLGLFLKKETPRDEVIEKVKERAARRGLMAVPN